MTMVEGLSLCLVLLISACCGSAILSDKNKVNDAGLTGCLLPDGSWPDVCTDLEGGSITALSRTDGTIPTDTMCLLTTGVTTTYVICAPQGELVSVGNETHKLRMKRFGELTGLGASVGAMFSPIGAAIGAGIGLIGDIICIFFCSSKGNSGPPPNQPPSIGQATLQLPSPIIVAPNKTSAIVRWTDPHASDPEDKDISKNVKTSPAGAKGQEFSEGSFYISFSVQDSGGLSAYSGLNFQVKVVRCPQPRWKEHGRLVCSSSTFISGSVCWLECNKGYNVDSNGQNLIMCTLDGQAANWAPMELPQCTPKECNTIPIIDNGFIGCPSGKGFYGEVCGTVCEEGYVLRGSSGIVMCDQAGTWPNLFPHCGDNRAPHFTMCPEDKNVNIDSKDNTASVSWELPKGEDNSNEDVIIEEQHGQKPGDRFSVGIHTIRYTIRDKSGNTGNSCSFSVFVSTIECEEPDFGAHMKYQCPDFYRFGAECKVSCTSGYPNVGVDTIQCSNPTDRQPPKLEWTWDKNGLKPSCRETACHDLAAPANGALACSLWDHGNICQMQCQNGFDVPMMRDGMFVCGTSDGKWRPDENVPDCIVPNHAHSMNLRSDLYYYTGQCNSSAQNLEHIKDSFIQALTGSSFKEMCIGVPECQSKFVNVTCGPVTSRRRRDITLHFRGRRSSSPFAYMITFELTVPFSIEPGQSALDVTAANENVLNDMIDKIQAEVDLGKFDLHISDLHTDSSSLGPGVPQLTCPHGSQGKAESGTCIGCPTGRYFSSDTNDCQYCPVGTYQDESASLECKKCPSNTNTSTFGAKSLDQCLAYCEAGTFSSSGLTPCTVCPTNMYQPEVYQTGCLSCQTGSRAAVTGSTSNKTCSVYDIVVDSSSRIEVYNNQTDRSFTFLTWMKLRSTNGSHTIFQISSNDTAFSLAIIYEETIKIRLDGVTEDSRVNFTSNKWYHVGLKADSVTKELSLYINEKLVYNNTGLTISRANLLETGDSIHIGGDLHLSSLSLTMRSYTEQEIFTAAKTCQGSYTDALYTIDDFNSPNAQIAIPSRCDAVDECESSPCNGFQCINKMADYECVCTGNFTGKNCETPPDFCQSNDCMNGATCKAGITNYTCACPYGYSGKLCEKRAVDGGWSEWAPWAICSASCGGGQTTRKRVCDSPLPDTEGRPCQGDEQETQSCNPEICPECSVLRRSFGVIMTCNETGDYTRCTISCRTNLYFATPPLTFYECGKITGYVWNHVTKENPHGRLPACTTVKPPSQMSLSLEGNYDTVPCSPHNAELVVQQLEAKFNTLDCVTQQSCHARAVPEGCDNPTYRRKRATTDGLKLTIHLETSVDSSLTGMTMDQLTGNNSGNANYLQQIIQQVLHLEKTAQEISNKSQTFFQMTIDGQVHTIATGTSGLTVTPEARCPPGSIRLDVFCAESPAGSYSNGVRVTMCPKGQYQDRTGQSSCQQCPPGLTTVGIGSEHVDECSERTTATQVNEKKTDDDESGTAHTVGIVVGSVVSIGFFILCGVVGTLAWKHIAKKKRQVSDSYVDLYGFRTPHVEPTKPVFHKTPL